MTWHRKPPLESRMPYRRGLHLAYFSWSILGIMKIVGDLNVATALMSAFAAAVVSFVIARSISVRQARAGVREAARRNVAALVAPLLGHVRLTLASCEDQRVGVPNPRVGSWRELAVKDMLRELARASDDLGRIRRHRVRILSVRTFGPDFGRAFLARWNSDSAMHGAWLRAVMVRPASQPSKPVPAGLWIDAEQKNPPTWLLQVLEASLSKLYGCGALTSPAPRAVRRRTRIAVRMRVIWLALHRRWPLNPPVVDDDESEAPMTDAEPVSTTEGAASPTVCE